MSSTALRVLFSCSLAVLGAAACDEAPAEPDAARPDANLLEDAGRPVDAGDTGDPDGGVVADGGLDGGAATCPRALAPADRPRFAVVGHPFGTPTYEVLALGEEGTLSPTGRLFRMGEGSDGTIAFTPDGEVGIVAQDDGTLGVFRLDASGGATVVHAAYEGAFYASEVVMDPAGDAAWVLDAQWRESGGGVYRIGIGCDGAIVDEALVAPARLAYGMALADDGAAVLASKDVLDTSLGPDVHVVDLSAPAVLASGEVFAEDDWIVAGFALTANGRHAILGDNAAFSATGNRLGVASIGEGTVSGAQVIAEVDDPVAIVASPFDDAVLVVSGFGDALLHFAYDPDAAEPLTLVGELAYADRAPALPAGAVMIERGSLEGLVLVSENVAIRRVRFEGAGVVTDLGPLELGEGLDAIAGAIGVQP